MDKELFAINSTSALRFVEFIFVVLHLKYTGQKQSRYITSQRRKIEEKYFEHSFFTFH